MANSKLRPELNLNRAEVTEWNRKLNLGFSHSRKEKGDVRRNQKAHVLHSKALVVGEHASLFLLSSTCSGEWLNNPTQLPGTTGEKYPFIFLPHTALRDNDASCSAACLTGKGQLQKSPELQMYPGQALFWIFLLYSPCLFLAVSSPPAPQIRVSHKDRGDL